MSMSEICALIFFRLHFLESVMAYFYLIKLYKV